MTFYEFLPSFWKLWASQLLLLASLVPNNVTMKCGRHLKRVDRPVGRDELGVLHLVPFTRCECWLTKALKNSLNSWSKYRKPGFQVGEKKRHVIHNTCVISIPQTIYLIHPQPCLNWAGQYTPIISVGWAGAMPTEITTGWTNLRFKWDEQPGNRWPLHVRLNWTYLPTIEGPMVLGSISADLRHPLWWLLSMVLTYLH